MKIRRYDMIVVGAGPAADFQQRSKLQNVELNLSYLMKTQDQADSFLNRYINSLVQKNTKLK